MIKCSKCKKIVEKTTISDPVDSIFYVKEKASKENISVNTSPQNTTHRKPIKCSICCEENANSGFVHDDSVHIGICYVCAVQTQESTGLCPFCRKKIDIVAKIF